MRQDRKTAKLDLAEGLSQSGSSKMCDYSLHNVKSRPAQIGDKLTTRNFGTGTRGFAASEDATVAVCVLPGTELSFVSDVTHGPTGLLNWRSRAVGYRNAIFRQINKENAAAHHDALEFPDGRVVLRLLWMRASKLRFFSYRHSPRLLSRLRPKNA